MTRKITPIANRERSKNFFDCASGIGLHDPELHITDPLARSGESLIFEGIHYSLGKVAIKVGCRAIAETCQEIAKRHDTIDSAAIESVEGELRTSRRIQQARIEERAKELGRYFPSMVVPEYATFQPVSLSGSLLDYSLRSHFLTDTSVPDLHPEETYLLEAMVRVQPFVPALHDNNRTSLSTRYAEITWSNEGYTSEDDYIDATSDLVFGEKASASRTYSLEELLKIQGSPYLKKLAIQAQNNSQLAEELRDFLDNLAAYTTETGGALVDVIGRDNVFYLGTRGIMTDGLYAEDTTPITGTAIALDTLAEGTLPTRNRMNECFNAFNFIRGMNIIAIACASPIRFSLDIPQAANIELVIKQILDLSREQYGLRGTSRVTQ